MALAVVRSRGLSGMFAPEVTVEVHLANGLPSFTLVGLPDTEVKEARERVRAALQNNKFEFPSRRITVNLAPADLPKESGRFDLPIAIGILVASGQLTGRALDKFEFVGELSLTGELRPIRGTLAMTYAVAKVPQAKGPRGFVLPYENADEAALVGGIDVFPARDLLQVVSHLEAAAGNGQARAIAPHVAAVRLTPPAYPDLFEERPKWEVLERPDPFRELGDAIQQLAPATEPQWHPTVQQPRQAIAEPYQPNRPTLPLGFAMPEF